MNDDRVDDVCDIRRLESLLKVCVQRLNAQCSYIERMEERIYEEMQDLREAQKEKKVCVDER